MLLCIKANGKKINVNALDATSESFLNEEVTGILGLQEPYQKVTVLNSTIETFQTMPLTIQIESVSGVSGVFLERPIQEMSLWLKGYEFERLPEEVATPCTV